MPKHNEDSAYGRGSSNFNDGGTLQHIRQERDRADALFSANGSFNPTNLAVENSLKEIFDKFHVMVSGELRLLNIEEDDK